MSGKRLMRWPRSSAIARISVRSSSSIDSVAVWMRTSAAARSASTWSIRSSSCGGALLDLVDAAVELALGAFDALLDVEAGVLAQGVELAAQRLVLGARAALLGEHLFDPAADPFDLLVQLRARPLGGQ